MYRIAVILAGLVFIGLMVGSGPLVTQTHAATSIVVTTAVDTIASDGHCSLREAIDAANATDAGDLDNADCGSPDLDGDDTIGFDDSVTSITLGGTQLPTVTIPVTIDGGENGVTIDADGKSGIFEVDINASLTINHLTLENAAGGAIDGSFHSTVVVTDSTFSGNSANNGGAIHIANTGSLSVTGSSFVSNSAKSADDGGGAIHISPGVKATVVNSTFTGNSAPRGGAITMLQSATIGIVGSTFIGNSATGTPSPPNENGAGGAINNTGGVLTATNSTFAGNSAYTGGAVYGSNGSDATLKNLTFAGNSAAQALNGGAIFNGDTVRIWNSIISRGGGTAACGGAGEWSGSNNLSDESNCLTDGVFTRNVSNLNLSALGDFGGTTETILPLAGSAAIDAGDNTICDEPGVDSVAGLDQRGEPRSDGACDVGAVEVNAAADYVPGDIVVTTGNDNVDNANDCSLREAVQSADTGVPVDTCQGRPGDNTITFADGIDTVTLDQGYYMIINQDRTVDIDGGANGVTIDANQTSRHFAVGGDLTLNHLTLENGEVSGGDFFGGSVYVSGTLTVLNSTFIGNTGIGGAIAVRGVLYVANSTFADNVSFFSGGAIDSISGEVTIANSTFSGNSASDPDDGVIAIDDDSTLTMTNSLMVGNATSNCEGGGTWNGSHNFVDDDSCQGDAFSAGFAMQETSAAINLGPLQPNGGPTQTMLPGPQSVAIDAGDDTTCASDLVANTDQRGETRPADGDADGTATCDVGAVEVVARDTGLTLTASVTGSPTTYGTPLTLSVQGVPTATTGTVTFADGTTTYCTVTGNTACDSDQSLGAGTYGPVVARYSGDATHYAAISTNSISFTVGKKALSVTASSPAGINYGDAIPAVTPSYDGFVLGQDADDLTTKPTCKVDDGPPYNAGGHTTSCSGGVSPNYEFQYNKGSLTINKVGLSITASSPSIQFGAPIPAITPSYAGFLDGDSANDLTTAPVCTTTATSASPVGIYPTSCADAASSNYTISYVPGTLAIGTAPTTTTVAAVVYIQSTGVIVSLSADVAAGTGVTVDEGTVTFTSGGATICTQLVDNGHALCTITPTPASGGRHSYVASYSGSASFDPSSGASDAVAHAAQPSIASAQTLPGEIVVQGGGFSGATSVTVCDVSVPFTVVSDTVIIIGIPAIDGPRQCTVVIIAAGGAASSAGTITVTATPQPGTPVVTFPTGPSTPSNPSCSATTALSLSGQWTLIAWPGANTAVADALSGGSDGCGSDVSAQVAVIWGFDAATQTYHAYFPSATSVPGANDLTTLVQGMGYWIALADPSSAVTWDVVS